MADFVRKEIRSKIMASVRQRNTKPELVVRSLLHKMGYRFRLHGRDLPGTPDIILPKHHAVLFINGCFWHQHPGCSLAKRPSSNTKYWDAKLDENITRDDIKIAALNNAGWKVLVIWQCETNELSALAVKLQEFLRMAYSRDTRRLYR